ncbi:NAD-dependent epimerase/dehydratase [Prauserella cavernicola]|uniref:NAD-dependent epimerase/dehydratase n=1 Tax=Prauserella cavernicola TaxID=2800127 RepID=UPI0027DDDC90|nr:NAD-dependent epimerase/dehydratase [Prauserella cavernicola]
MADSTAAPLITVLGASGMLGTALTRELATQPVRLRLVGRRPSTPPPDCRAEIEVREADLTTGEHLADAVADADSVVHLVAHIAGPGTWRVADGDRVAERVNVGLVHDVIEAIRAQRRSRPPVVAFAGSVSQAGHSAASADGTGPDLPLTGYDRHKLEAEQALESATREGLVRGITLRLATLFSQGSDPIALDSGVVAVMMRRAFAGKPLTMWHDGTVKRDMLCVDDAARAFVAALEHPDRLAGEHWTIGTGQATSIFDLFSTIAKVVSSHTKLPPVPVLSVPPAEHSLATDLVDFVATPARFEQACGWTPRESLIGSLDRTAAAVAAELGDSRR